MIGPKLIFVDGPLGGECDFVATIPAGIRNRTELFAALRSELRLPTYFGENFDALDECLRDLSWIAARRVIIAHRDLPNLGTDVPVYLSVLIDSMNDWRPGDDHELVVSFPTNAREAILEAMKSGG